ncbi:MAG: hypothetical protein IKT79_02215, partial [Akkermansia sp.]|nr:hypothetical protein [Akkermansia sp.]
DAISIVKNKDQIMAHLWPEEDYFELNVIYKASKNSHLLLPDLPLWEELPWLKVRLSLTAVPAR